MNKDRDGRCDSSVVYAQDPELVAPLGILVLEEEGKSPRVLVSCSPSIFEFRDRNGDGDALDAGEKEIFLTGFGGHDHDHGVHSLVEAPNGRLYVAVGNAGQHIVTDRSGWTLRSGSVYNDGGPAHAGNRPGAMIFLGERPEGSTLLGFSTVAGISARRQHFVEHDTEGVNVSGHRRAAAGSYFGSGVTGRQIDTARMGSGDFAQQPGDAEIEQPRPAVTIDHDVRWLEIAVDHQVAVGERHRPGQVEKQLQSGAPPKPGIVAPGDQRQAVDQLQGEPGLALWADPGIEQRGNVRMR